MDIAGLKERAKQGESISKEEASFLAEQELEVLRQAADEVRNIQKNRK